MKYTVENFRKDLDSKYAWPGGYPLFFICKDGGCLSHDAAKENQTLIESAMIENYDPGWQVVSCTVNWEDTDLYCDHTGQKIESAYGED